MYVVDPLSSIEKLNETTQANRLLWLAGWAALRFNLVIRHGLIYSYRYLTLIIESQEHG